MSNDAATSGDVAMSDDAATSASSEAPQVDRRMLDLLVCPQTRGRLEWRPETEGGVGELVSRTARLAYPVRDGVPILVASEAREMAEEELG